MYATLLMSSGLTFGSISALFGLSHDIIDQGQYSSLIVTAILSAVVPSDSECVLLGAASATQRRSGTWLVMGACT